MRKKLPQKLFFCIVGEKRIPIVANGNQTLDLLVVVTSIILHIEHHLNKSKSPKTLVEKIMGTAKQEIVRVLGL